VTGHSSEVSEWCTEIIKPQVFIITIRKYILCIYLDISYTPTVWCDTYINSASVKQFIVNVF